MPILKICYITNNSILHKYYFIPFFVSLLLTHLLFVMYLPAYHICIIWLSVFKNICFSHRT